MTALLLVLSTIFLLIAPITYTVSIMGGKTRPHRLTRLALMAELLLAFASALGAHANQGILLLTGISAIYGVTIFGLSLWRGMGGGKNLLDWTCFLIAIVGLIAWKLSGDALIALWFAIVADLMAYVPAYVKTWRYPETESHWFYTFYIIGALLTLIVYPLEAASAFQVYVIAGCIFMIFCIYRKQILAQLQSVVVAAIYPKAR